MENRLYIFVVLLCILLLSGCTKNTVVSVRTSGSDSVPMETMTLSGFASLCYLPEQPGCKTNFFYEVHDGIIYQTGFVKFESGAEAAYFCNSFDKNGNALKNRKFKITDNLNYGGFYILRDEKIIADELIARSSSGQWEERHLLLSDAEQTSVLAEADITFLDIGGGCYLETEHYFCRYNSFILELLDKNLSLLAEVEIPLTGMAEITGIRELDENTLLFYFSQNIDEEYLYDAVTGKDDRYLLYHVREQTFEEYDPGVRETPESRQASACYEYRTDSGSILYFRTPEGIYRQDAEEDVCIVDFSASCLSSERLRILDTLPDDRFLVQYTHPLTHLTQTAVLIPEKEQTVTFQPITLASVGVPEGRLFRLLTDCVTYFNQSQSEYRVFYHAYGVTDRDTPLSAVEKDILNGKLYDIYLFGLDLWGTDESRALYRTLTEKDIFLDLMETADENKVLPSLTEAFLRRNRLPGLPVCASYSLLCCRNGELQYGEPFTLETLQKIADELERDGTHQFTNSESIFANLRTLGLHSFYDLDNRTCSYDSPEFLAFLDCLDTLRRYIQTSGGSGERDQNIIDGVLRFPGCGIQQQALATMYYCMGGGSITYCGFPGIDGTIYAQPIISACIPKDAEGKDGALALLSFLLSDKVQTSTAFQKVGNSVTEQGIADIFPVGISHFSTMGGYISYLETVKEAEELPDGLRRAGNEIRMALTEDDKTAFLDRITTMKMFWPGEDTITEIIEEELSAADAGVRSRAEAAKIIQNRVMLYLNE